MLYGLINFYCFVVVLGMRMLKRLNSRPWKVTFITGSRSVLLLVVFFMKEHVYVPEIVVLID